MYKFIFDNTKNKKLKDLSLIPGFNLDNNTQKKTKIIESEKIIDDNTFTNFFNLINESSVKKLTRKNKTKNNKTKKI